jgi:hypothetical protein
MTPIIFQADLLSVAALLSLPVPLVLASFALDRERPSHKTTWLAAAGLALGVTGLFTPQALFLLPILVLVVLREKSPLARIGGYSLFLVATLTGSLVVGQRDGTGFLEGMAGTLWPYLGPRWLENTIWICGALLVLVVLAPERWSWLPVQLPARLPARLLARLPARLATRLPTWLQPGHSPDSTSSPARCLFLGAGWFLLLGTTARLVGAPLLAGHQGWIAITFFTLGAGWTFVTRLLPGTAGRGLKPVPAVLSLLGLSLWCLPFFWAGPGGASAPLPDGFERGDLLLVDQELMAGLRAQESPTGDQTRMGLPRIPPAALITFRSIEQLDALLAPTELAGFPGALHILSNRPLAAPWFEVTDQRGPLVHRFLPGSKPGPLVLLADTSPAPELTGMQGLFEDGAWTGDRLQLEFTPGSAGWRQLEMRLRGWRPPGATPLLPGLRLELNGTPLPDPFQQQTFLRWDIPAGLLVSGTNRLRLTIPTFVPAEVMSGSTDGRRLGLDLESLTLR